MQYIRSKQLGLHKPRLQVLVISLLCLFLLIFPKGGIKIGNLPITWGYLFLLITILFNAISSGKKICRLCFYSLISLLPFQVISLVTICTNGYSNTGYFVSLLLNFFIFPYAFLGFFSEKLTASSINLIFSWIKKGVLFVAISGIFLFFYKIFFGSFLEIPLLTINFHDRNQLELAKCIDRGGIFKLISTYNNGNLYGICILMLLPLYNTLETSQTRKLIVKSSLILTLSRTIWLGLLFVEFFYYVSQTGDFRKKLFSITILFALTTMVLVGVRYIFPFNLDFLFDRLLGTRIGQFAILKNARFFSNMPFEEVYEIVYLGIIKSFGYSGLLFYIIGMTMPMVLSLTTVSQSENGSKIKRSLILGIVCYLFISLGDGALLLIPVICFYWTLCMLLLAMNSSSKEIQ